MSQHATRVTSATRVTRVRRVTQIYSPSFLDYDHFLTSLAASVRSAMLSDMEISPCRRPGGKALYSAVSLDDPLAPVTALLVARAIGSRAVAAAGSDILLRSCVPRADASPSYRFHNTFRPAQLPYNNGLSHLTRSTCRAATQPRGALSRCMS